MRPHIKLKHHILWKLYHHHYIGKRHTDKRNLPKGLPSHEYGACLDVADDLIKEGWLVAKKTKSGNHVSINPRAIKTVRDFLEKIQSTIA